MTQQDQRQVIEAAKQADWQQVVLNGGPPCFHLESEGKFCLRAERWQGHGGDDYPFHRFVSLPMLLTAMRSTPPPTPQEPQCTGPFSDAFDCPVHDPRKRVAPVLPAPVPEFTAEEVLRELKTWEQMNAGPWTRDTSDVLLNMAAMLRAYARTLRPAPGDPPPFTRAEVEAQIAHETISDNQGLQPRTLAMLRDYARRCPGAGA